jgi:ribosomal protein L11 methyltransferase
LKLTSRSDWLEVSVRTDGEGAEAVAETLRPFAHQESVVLVQLQDPHTVDISALSDEVAVKIYIAGDEDTSALRLRLQEVLYYLSRLYPLPEPVFNELQNADWASIREAHCKPFRVGERLWILPSWSMASDSVYDVVLTLDAGTAFGTGLHPTTQMCLLALEQLVKPGMKVLDVGTGSGILAIAAAKLGAAEVFGVDTDMLAVNAARQNISLNKVEQSVMAEQGELKDVMNQNWDIVIVNILAPVIDHLLKEADLVTYMAENGCSILSGIVQQQTEMIETAIEAGGGQLDHTRTLGKDWITFVAVPK